MSGRGRAAPTAADPAEARERMVERQLRRRGITDERVLEAMGRVPRQLFVPEHLRHLAYEDGALPIGGGQTISQPFIVATICSLLQLRGDERVLDVGTGSGYQAAVLAELAAEVVTIERVPELAERARETLALAGYDRVEVRIGDGSLGAPRPGALRRDRGRRCRAGDSARALRAARRRRTARPPARRSLGAAARSRGAHGRGAGRARLGPVPLRASRRRRGLRPRLTRPGVAVSACADTLRHLWPPQRS